MTNPFETNQHKANLKVSINSAMIGALFLVLTFTLATGPSRFHLFVMAQLVLAIPLLYVSILTYCKIAYWQNTAAWDALGWFTTYLGNSMVLNAIGLMVATYSRGLAAGYFALTLIMIATYSTINTFYHAHSIKIKVFKFMFFIATIIIGGLVPFWMMR